MDGQIVWSRDLVRVTDTHFTMRVARARHRAERRIHGGLAFRAWARRTYNAFACTGKLKACVGRRAA